MLSVVLVTYNSAGHIERCLSSLQEQMLFDVEIIIVDNGSTDTTVSIVEATMPKACFIKLTENIGASAARNRGIQVSRGEWVLTLDSDVVLGKDFIGSFLFFHKGLADKVGMVQTNILSSDREKVYSHGVYLTSIKRAYDVDKGKPKSYVGKKVAHIIGPCSAAAFYRRAMLEVVREQTGYFDERFFFLFEDVDLAWRASCAGWKTVFLQQSVCYHQGNGSSLNLQYRQYLCYRNRHKMIQKQRLSRRAGIMILGAAYELIRGLWLLMTNKNVQEAVARFLLTDQRAKSSAKDLQEMKG